MTSKSCFLFGALLIATGAIAQHTDSWVNRNTGVATSYTVPSWLEISDCSAHVVGSNTVIEFDIGAPIPGSVTDLVCFGAQYGDRLVVLPLGGYTMPSSPSLVPGQVGVLDIASGNVVAYGTFSTNGSQLSLQVPTTMLGGQVARTAVTCFLPGGTDLSLSIGNFGGHVADTFPLKPGLADYETLIPNHPDSAGALNLGPQQPVRAPWVLPETLTSPPQRGQAVPRSNIGPTNEPGYDFQQSCPWPGRPGYYVNLYSIAGSFRIGYGYDANYNNVLDPWEVTQWIAKCGYAGGHNGYYGWFQGADGKWYFTWRNYSHNLHQSLTYVYDPWNNTLKVYNQNGVLVYNGPPNGFWGWPSW